MINIAKSSFLNVIFKFLSLSLIFLFQSFLTKIVNIEIYGKFSKFLVYSNYFSLLFSFGLSASIIYYSNTKKEFISLLNSTFLIYIFLLVIGFLINISINIKYEQYFMYYAFGLLLNLITLSLSYYQFSLKFLKFGLFGLIQAVFVIFNLLIIYLYPEIAQNINKIIYIYISTNIIFLSLVLFDIYQDTKNFFLKKISIKLKYFKYGIKVVSIVVISQFIYISDYMLIDYFLEDKYLAYYFVAMIVAKMIFVFADTTGGIIYSLYSNDKIDNKAIDHSVYFISSVVFLISIFLLIFFYLFGINIIHFFYSNSYTAAYYPTLFLIAGTEGMVIYKFLSRKLATEEKWEKLYISVAFAAFINIVLNIFLIPKYGINGASFASMLSYWICGLTLVYLNNENILNYLFYIKRAKS